MVKEAIKVNSLTKRYGDRLALDKISFTVKKNVIHGFLGPNGAGKTTTIRIIMGLIKNYEGSITILGMDPTREKFKVYSRIGYTPEVPKLPEFLTAVDFLRLVGKMYGLSSNILNEKILEVLRIVGLSHEAKKKIGAYSKGMVQRLALAHALIGQPELLILDEPTLGMDPEGRVYIRELFKDLKKEGITIFLSSHLLEEVEKVCDFATLIYNGKILATDSLGNVLDMFTDKWLIEIELANFVEGIDRLISSVNFVEEVKCYNNLVIVYLSEKVDIRHRISEIVTKAGGIIIGMRLIKKNLEEVYLKAVSGG